MFNSVPIDNRLAIKAGVPHSGSQNPVLEQVPRRYWRLASAAKKLAPNGTNLVIYWLLCRYQEFLGLSIAARRLQRVAGLLAPRGLLHCQREWELLCHLAGGGRHGEYVRA